MFEMVFHQRCEVVVNILQENTLMCILSLGENVQTIFPVSTQHSRRIQWIDTWRVSRLSVSLCIMRIRNESRKNDQTPFGSKRKELPICGVSRCVLIPHTFNYSSLVFIDTVAHASGFCFLFDHVLQNHHALSENGFTLTAIVYCLLLSVSQINSSNYSIKMNSKELTKHKFTSLFDKCLLAISVHKYRRTNHIWLSRDSRMFVEYSRTIHQTMKMKCSSAWKNLWKEHL